MQNRRMKTIDAFDLRGGQWRERFALDRALSDLIKKGWMEGAVPLFLGICLTFALLWVTPLGLSDSSSVLNEVVEKGLVAIGLTLVMVGGGIDLSVGSIVGAAAISSLVADRVWGWPSALTVLFTLAVGAGLGAINGFAVAFVKTRPFITTLVTLLAFRGIVKWLQGKYSLELTQGRPNIFWDFLVRGSVAGIPTTWFILLVVLITGHLLLTRSRWGWWVKSVGADRRSARRNGVPVDRVVFFTYVLSGLLAALAGILTSARLGRADQGVGEGWEIIVLTAVVLGGVSLKGGRGSFLRAMVGVLVVATLYQATIAGRFGQGALTTLLALVLLVFAIIDLKWGKYRGKMAQKLALSPASLQTGNLLDVTKPGTPWSVNNKLGEAPPIGLGVVQGPEDCAIDAAGNLYCGDRRGWVWRFEGPDHTKGRVFARTGGVPLGHAWDHDGNLLVCAGGIGVYRIHADGSSHLLTNRVARNWRSWHDDAAIRFADDVDVAPDGSIYVSDFSNRTNASEYHSELIEYRPNGRIVRIDPDGSAEVVVRNHTFPNGMCTSHDGQSILVASTGMFRVDRLWIAGPKQGTLEPLLENLPGYPDNINRASDGNYWMSFVGTRTPFSDLVLRHRSTRLRMIRELPSDEWLVPQLNVSCVVKFNEQGEILNSMWDETLERYPMVTSLKEHAGILYLCGVNNNRLGRLVLSPDQVGSIDTRVVPGARQSAPAFGGAR